MNSEKPNSTRPPSLSDSLYKQILLKGHYLSSSQMAVVMKQYAETLQQGRAPALPEFLVQHGVLSPEQHQTILQQAQTLSQAQTAGQTEKVSGLLEKKIQRMAHYEILSEIASGGMGIVYKARDVQNGEIVALKVLHTPENPDPKALKRFEREAESAIKAHHPNVVNVREFGQDQQIHYLVMDFIEGKPLADYLPRKVQECVEIIIQLCHALHAMHNQGIIHRDIKPDNILMDYAHDPPLPKITDFSLALMDNPLQSRFTQTGAALGTPYYMSPEQAMGNKAAIDRRTDVYSLGVVFYELLTRKLPFQAGTMTELYAKIMHEQPEPPSSIRHAIKKELDEIALKAMAKEPAHRYPTCQAMAEDLEAYLSGQKLKHGSSLIDQLRQKGWLKKTHLLIAALVLLLLGTIATSAILLTRRAPVDSHLLLEAQLGEARARLAARDFRGAMEKVAIARMLAPQSAVVQELENQIQLAMASSSANPPSHPTQPETSFSAYLQEAQAALQAKDFSRALEKTLAARQLTPQSPVLDELEQQIFSIKEGLQAAVERVEMLYAAGDTANAAALVKQIPDCREEANKVFSIFNQLESMSTNDAALWPALTSIDHLRPAYYIACLETFSPQTVAPLFRALCALQLKQFQEAYQALTPLGDRSALGRYFRGKARIYLGDWERGKADLRTVVAGWPRPPWGRGTHFYHLGTTDVAEAYAHIKDSPTCCLDGRMIRAAVLAVIDQLKGTAYRSPAYIAQLEKLARDDQVPGAFLYLGTIQAQNQITQAGENWKKALQAGVPAVWVSYHRAHAMPAAEGIEAFKNIAQQMPELADPLLKAGQLSLETNRFTEALSFLQRALSIAPETVEKHSYLGIAQLMLDQWPGAFQSFERAIELFHQGPYYPSSTHACIAYLHRGQILERLGRWEEATRAYHAAIDLAPLLTDPLEMFLERSMKKNRYYEALEFCFERRPEIALKNGSLGAVSLATLKQKALEENSQRLAQQAANPTKTAELYAKRAFIYFLMKNSVEFSSCLKQSLSTAPTAEGYFIRAITSFIHQKYAEAIRDCDQALRRDPKHHRARFLRIRCYGQTQGEATVERFSYLCGEFDTLLAQAPEYYQHTDDFFHHISLCLNQFRSIKEPQFLRADLAYRLAKAPLNKSNGRHNQTWAYFDCTWIQQDLKEFDQALALFDKMVAFEQEYHYGYWYRGRLREVMGQYERALADFEMALYLLQDTADQESKRQCQSETEALKKKMKK